MKRGDFVKTLFDTGAMGYTTCYGVVERAGSATYTVCWESGNRNRCVQSYRGVERVERADIDPRVLARLEGR